MASLSDDEIIDAVARRVRADLEYERQLREASTAKSDSWVTRLVRGVVGVLVEVGRAVLLAITGWFIPKPPW
jgi:hypothetical protein